MEVLLCDLAGPSYHRQERQLLTPPQSSLSCLYSLIIYPFQSSTPNTNNERRLGTSQVYEPDNWQNTSTNCEQSLPVTLVVTSGSRLNHSLCNLIEAMWIVILEQYEGSTDKLPTKVPLKIQSVPLERENKQLNLTNPNFLKKNFRKLSTLQ